MKLFAILTMFLGLFTIAAEPAPVAAWTFDGTAAGLEAHGADGKTVVPRFADAAKVPGIQGQAIALGVQAGDAEYLTAPAPKLGADYTIEAWIWPTQLSGWNRLVLNWGDKTRYAYHFALHDSQVSLCQGLSGGRFVMCEGGNVEPERWQQIVGVAARNQADPAKSTLKVFLNGKLAGTILFDGSAGDGGTEPLGIGDSGSLASAGSRYHGYLDAVTLWTRPLGDAEIAARYETRRGDLEKLYRSATPIPAIGEIVFSERHPGRDPSSHYYANFGYACTNENEWIHGADGGHLAILNPATGQVRTLFALPLPAMYTRHNRV
jgi:hypothetical protein